jgi:hypothetical protein
MLFPNHFRCDSLPLDLGNGGGGHSRPDCTWIISMYVLQPVAPIELETVREQALFWV